MSGWKHNLQLLDLEAEARIEITCRTCGYVCHARAGRLLADERNAFLYLDELEARLRCRARGCHGHVRIALSAETETEGFQGGLS
ncbi:MAG TPA: hypothetical protein ENK01_00520 [Hellea balneolensis]|uniref:Uncharacterized protein n=1 Tax=Hellea balneolensis TaxID=287478 RepID=A0A7V5U0Y7_9PROT|nr:hypothetical protein [Hellea balneolensis]